MEKTNNQLSGVCEADTSDLVKPRLPAVPIRMQRSRKQKQVSPNGLPCVYVGRPSKWGNPFRDFADGVYVNASHRRKILSPWVQFSNSVGAANLFRNILFDLNSLELEPDTKKAIRLMRDTINDLSGKNLVCWCKSDCECHADSLLELANPTIYTRDGNGDLLKVGDRVSCSDWDGIHYGYFFRNEGHEDISLWYVHYDDGECCAVLDTRSLFKA